LCLNSYLSKLYFFITGSTPSHWIYFGNHLHKRSPLNNLIGRTPPRYKQPTKDHGQKKRDSCANTAVVLITNPFVPEGTFSNPAYLKGRSSISALFKFQAADARTIAKSNFYEILNIIISMKIKFCQNNTFVLHVFLLYIKKFF